MSRNIVFEGWLTKSPPTKRIWRTKWRRRWFALRQSGELPGQYFLDYYADRNCRRLKGTINLDLCEQVDAGLHMERSNNGTLDPKLRGSVFTIQTQSRTYHLEADCEADMAKWVDAICRVCGLQSKDNSNEAPQDNYEMTTMNERYEAADNTDPYIPISECITGVRSQNSHRAFTFDPKNIVISTRKPAEKVSNRNHQMYMSQPHIRPHNPELSENDSNMSEEESKSLNASQSNIREWAAAKSYTKSTVGTHKNEDYQPGPPVPPRPPKTFAMSKEAALKNAQTPSVNRVHDPIDAPNRTSNSTLRVPARLPATGPPSPSHPQIPTIVVKGEDDEESSGQSSMQYCNVLLIPPAVDRNLKPRHSSHSLGPAQNLGIQFQTVVQINRNESRTVRSEVLQYLDLDLGPSKPSETKDINGKSIEMIHGRTAAALEARSVYKTVDFLKTEAFNITRQDAEASRNIHH